MSNGIEDIMQLSSPQIDCVVSHTLIVSIVVSHLTKRKDFQPLHHVYLELMSCVKSNKLSTKDYNVWL